jgi:hypothetical protein
LELFSALHFKSSSKKLFFQAPEGASMVALLGQEKIRFFDSGLSIAVWAIKSRFPQKILL